MSNPSKAKGTAAETAIVRWLRANGFPFADRQPLRGGRDQGDIAICPGVIAEVKNHKTPASGLPSAGVLADWIGQTELEQVNANAELAILIVKRHGTTDPGRWHCWINRNLGGPAWRGWMMAPLADVAHMLRTVGYGDPLETEAVAS